MCEIHLAFEEIEENGPGKGIETDWPDECRFRVSQSFEACFDFNFPFRPLLTLIRDCMRMKESHVELVLQEYGEFEDFVTGSFDVASRKIAVYFEHSLAYLSFASDCRQDLELLIETTNGQDFQHEGYGLEDGQL